MGVKLRERPGKGWYVIIDWKGQRKAKFFGTNKKTAEEFSDKLTAKLKWAEQNGESVSLKQPDESMPLMKEYLTTWKEKYAEVHCKPSTYRGYARSIDEHLIPAFGNLPLDRVTRAGIRTLIAKLSGEGKARGTIENCLVPLKAVFYQAIDDGLIQVNPVARLGKIFHRRKDRTAHLAPLEREEVQHLMETVKEKVSHFYPLLLCAARTGMRQGELIGLKWDDIDFHGGFIEVRRGVVLREETTTKSHKIRRVDMSQQLQEVLRQLKEIRQLEAMSTGKEMVPWVFVSHEGKRWDGRNLRRTWRRCLTKADMRMVRFHDLRHTYASALAVQGVPPKYIQSQLGHSSIQVTMDVYSHFFEKRSSEWVNRLDDEGKIAGNEAESATQAQPGMVEQEHRADKSLKNMVAVTRIERVTRGL